MHCGGYSPYSVSFPISLLLFLMVDRPDFLGIPTGAHIFLKKKKTSNFKEFCEAYLSIFTGWCPTNRKLSPTSSGRDEVEANFEAISQAPEELGYDTKDGKTMNGIHSFRCNNADSARGDNPSSPRGFFKHKSTDGSCFPNVSSPLSRSGSRKSPSRRLSFLKRNMSRKSNDSNHGSSASLSRNASRKNASTIMFSNSTGKMKPPAIERPLECTLEELCYGCMKKIKITRDVITNTGQIIQEEEILTIKVKPGWKKGTKITFEGMGNERPGTLPADIIFVIAEKRHSLFRREGEDLEIGVEVPLVKALTGCRISIPLLGGEKTSLKIDDIIYPGYERIIEGQGMPNTKEQGKRGNLKVVFLVEFPAELTDEQRSDIVSILEDSS